MLLSDLRDKTLETPDSDCRDRERTATLVRTFAIRFHSAGFSFRETVAILDLLGVDRSHGGVWDWTHRLADNHDETAIQTGSEWRWCYAVIDLDSMLVLDIEVFSRCGTNPAAFTRAKLSYSTSEIPDFRGRRFSHVSPSIATSQRGGGVAGRQFWLSDRSVPRVVCERFEHL